MLNVPIHVLLVCLLAYTFEMHTLCHITNAWIMRHHLGCEHLFRANARFRMAQISLSDDLSCGTLSPREIYSEDFDVPTTALRKGNNLYAVNAKFGVEDPTTTEYEIIRVDRDDSPYTCPAR